MAQQDKATSERRSPRWMRVLLGVSLAVNLAVVGLAVGVAMRVKGSDGPGHPPRFGGAMMRALSPDDRRAVLDRARDQMAGSSRSRKDAGDMVGLLRADPYDHAALESMVATYQAERQNWISAMQGAWLTHVADMSPSERATYADALDAAEQRRRDKRHHKHRKKDKERLNRD